MKILHCCLSCFYIDGFNYQENQLVQAHVKQGHNVLVLASTETYDNKSQLTYCDPGQYTGTDGARVIRLPYSAWLPHKVMRKLRIYPGVYDQIANFAPDSILFHGACGHELVTVAKYVKDHPDVPFYVDSHEDWGNSAKGFISREILHKIYYRNRLQKALPSIGKVLGTTPERCNFVQDVYDVPAGHVELYPMGGHPVHDPEYTVLRNSKRAELGIADDTIVFALTGKMKARRKLVEALRDYTRYAPGNSVFLIGGMLTDETRKDAVVLINADSRIRNLGWQTANQLTDLLCATDIYLNPGSHSSTTEHSLCCRCAFALDDVAAHRILLRENGWLLNDTTTLEDVFKAAPHTDLKRMQDNSFELACDSLDYEMLAARILPGA